MKKDYNQLSNEALIRRLKRAEKLLDEATAKKSADYTKEMLGTLEEFFESHLAKEGRDASEIRRFRMSFMPNTSTPTIRTFDVEFTAPKKEDGRRLTSPENGKKGGHHSLFNRAQEILNDPITEEELKPAAEHPPSLADASATPLERGESQELLCDSEKTEQAGDCTNSPLFKAKRPKFRYETFRGVPHDSGAGGVATEEPKIPRFSATTASATADILIMPNCLI